MNRPESAIARVERLKAIWPPGRWRDSVNTLRQVLLFIDAADDSQFAGTAKELQNKLGGSVPKILNAITAGQMTGALAVQSLGSKGRRLTIDWDEIPDEGPLVIAQRWIRSEAANGADDADDYEALLAGFEIERQDAEEYRPKRRK